MPFLFAATLFVSAGLLFWVQPLIAKMLLPLLGGTPAVWNTCMLFFQGVLLAGYAYALVITRWLRAGAQAAVHLALLAVAFVSLPVGLSEKTLGSVPSEGEPAAWLLWTLAASAGLPFFALSATAPLLQKWFSRTRHKTAGDPYYLYAASNAGSLLALVAFPLVLEPTLRLAGQSRLWSWLYAALVALTAACAVALLRRAVASSEEGKSGRRTTVEEHTDEAGAERLTKARRARWAFLAFVPSSLVLGVTTYITTDVAAVPLLWVVPLAIYLLTFIIAFARGLRGVKRWADRLLPGACVVLTLVYLSGATEPAWFLILVHLLFLFIAALACHRRLADERPSTQHLAEFYLWVAAGGAAGGLFNAIVAPLIFNTIAEYPLAVVLAAFARVPFGVAEKKDEKKDKATSAETDGQAVANNDEAVDAEELKRKEKRALMLDVALPVATGIVVAALSALVMRLELASVERLAIALGAPLILINHLFTKRPLRFALALGAVMLGSFFYTQGGSRPVSAERNFYGTLRVSEDPSNNTRLLHHGSTIHGRQFPDARRCEPLSYYHRQGPLGSFFDAFSSAPPRDVAAVGLGTGAVAAYSRAGESWTFYEINPAVVRIARDESVFTYLRDCAEGSTHVVLGDARLQLRRAAPEAYGLIILDAFSSDAVPAHLLTREAMSLYLEKLAPGGVILFHVSNRALDLHTVTAALARDASLSALVFDDLSFDGAAGREPSQWVALARRPEDLAPLSKDSRWKPLTTPRLELWRDDFSDIISVFKWKG